MKLQIVQSSTDYASTYTILYALLTMLKSTREGIRKFDHAEKPTWTIL